MKFLWAFAISKQNSDQLWLWLNGIQKIDSLIYYYYLFLLLVKASFLPTLLLNPSKQINKNIIANQEILIQTTLLCIYLVSKMKWSIGWRCQSKMKCFKIRSFNISSSKNILFHELLTWTSLKTLYLSFRSTPILDSVWTDVFILVFSIECLETETKVVIKVHKAK